MIRQNLSNLLGRNKVPQNYLQPLEKFIENYTFEGTAQKIKVYVIDFFKDIGALFGGKGSYYSQIKDLSFLKEDVKNLTRQQLAALITDLSNTADKATQSLFKKAKAGDLTNVEILLRRNAIATKEMDYRGHTALTIAAANGHLDFVHFLCSKINFADADKNRALIEAAKKNQLVVVKYLLSIGAKGGVKDNWGFTALAYASILGHADVVNVLWTPESDEGTLRATEHRAKDTANVVVKGCNALTLASVNENPRTVQVLLAKGQKREDIELALAQARNRTPHIPSHYEEKSPNLEVIRLLEAQLPSTEVA